MSVAAIGMGWPAMAAHFKEDQQIPFTLLIDHDKQTYRALQMKHANAWNIYGPPVWIKGIKSILEHGNKFPKQDPLQLGGIVVADVGGTIRYTFRAGASSEVAPLDEVVAALP
ncbi:MAG: hypothetical protein QOG04_722 [Actinomycetota bacterium]|nr:hypothetical protein [Actinomycetota bacterium]